MTGTSIQRSEAALGQLAALLSRIQPHMAYLMQHAVPGFNLVLSLALLSAGPALAPIANAQAAPEASATAPVAYVYVQTSKGVEVFGAASNGKLAKVSGSPFADTGQMGAINGSYLVSVGTEAVRTYPIESNGGIGKQVSEIDAGSYGGGDCGPYSGMSSVMFSLIVWPSAVAVALSMTRKLRGCLL